MRLRDLIALAIADLSARLVYSLIVIAMLAFGVATAFVAVSQSQGVIAKEEELFQFLRPNLLIVHLSSPANDSQVKTVESLKYVSAVYPAVNKTVKIEVNSRNYTFYLLGLDNLSVITTYSLVAGTDFDYSGILIPSDSPVKLAPGTPVKVYYGGKAVTTYVAGVISYNYTVFQRFGASSSTLFPTYRYVFTSLNNAREIVGGKYDVLLVLTDSPQRNPEVIDEITSIFPNATVDSPGVSAEVIARQYSSFTAYLYSLSAVSLMTSVITNASVMAISFNRKLREVGVMMALGMRRSDLALFFALEGLALGAVGALSGLVAGFYATVNVVLTEAVSYSPIIYPDQVAGLVVLGLVASVAGSLYPVLRVLRLTPTEVMR